MDKKAEIKIIGVGGGGGAAVNAMILKGIEDVDFIAASTDAYDLKRSRSKERIQLGVLLTRGLGAGSDPEIGRDAALERHQEIAEALKGADAVIVVAGMGGGTGTGASPVIARTARELGSLVVGVVTVPYGREGRVRRRRAEAGLHELSQYLDCLLIVANDTLPKHTGSVLDSFKPSDDILSHAVRCLADLIKGEPEVFGDTRQALSSGDIAAIGTGEASGGNRFADATRAAVSSPLLDNYDLTRAKGALVTVRSAAYITFEEIEAVRGCIGEVKENTSVIVAVVDPLLGETVRVTAIFTGFDRPCENAVNPPRKTARSLWDLHQYDTDDPDDCA